MQKSSHYVPHYRDLALCSVSLFVCVVKLRLSPKLAQCPPRVPAVLNQRRQARSKVLECYEAP